MNARSALVPTPKPEVLPAPDVDDEELEELEDDAAFVRDLVGPLVQRFGAAEIVAAVADACAELSSENGEDAANHALDALERAAAGRAQEIYLSLSFNLETAAGKAHEIEQKLDEEP